MPEYDNRNTGTLFKNERKASDEHADYTGTWIDENNVEYWFSARIKTSSKTGKKFFSVRRGKRKDGQEQSQFGRPVNLKVGPSIDDEIPFAPEWR